MQTWITGDCLERRLILLRFKVHKRHTKTTEKIKGRAAVGSFGRDADTLRTVDYGRQFIV